MSKTGSNSEKDHRRNTDVGILFEVLFDVRAREMKKDKNFGYTTKILRIDLKKREYYEEEFKCEDRIKWIGGTGLGAKILLEEIPRGVSWDDPDNKLIFGIGPLTGTGFNGAGGFSLVGKGPMTNLAGCTQAQGFWGAYLKFSGFDGVVIEGACTNWTYLSIQNGKAELRDATHLLSKDTFETEEAIRRELGVKGKEVSVFSIGPAGENRVRFACVVGDGGHVASKNGLGAVMGSKRLKAIVVYRGKRGFLISDSERLKKGNEKAVEASKHIFGGLIYEWGTGGTLSLGYMLGSLPIKNYTTNIFPEHEHLDGKYIRTHFKVKNNPCYACRTSHCKIVTVTEGPYKGLCAPEAEYELLAVFGPMIGQSDPGTVVHLADLTDRMGIDGNEIGWIMGFVMEAYEKGILGKKDLDGLEMTWGNVPAVEQLILKIARREGIGDLLAEGVMRASRRIGGAALEMAIHAMDGTTPRGHDHRGRWSEMFDTCLSNTSTIEATFGSASPELYGFPPSTDLFSPEEVAGLNAKVNGWRQIDDSLVTCRFAAFDPKVTLECLNAVTGWELRLEDAMKIGRRIVNALRMFNLRHGHKTELEAPSPRYGSIPTDGPCKGIGVGNHWEKMREIYYTGMGWDFKTGKPFPETLKELELDDISE
jgi:aldehyde:ferredoxin oxidoreductase